MRLAAGHAACEHIALIHEDVNDLSRRLAPSLRRATQEGGAVLICVDPPAEARIRADIGSASDSFTFQPAAGRYALPGIAMAALHGFVDDAAASGAPTAWSIGAVPLVGDSRDASWIRYEGAVMSIFADRPLRAVCLYDAASTPFGSRAGIDRTHQRSDGHWSETGTTNTEAPTEITPSDAPDLVLHDPSPRDARVALERCFAQHLTVDQLTDLQLAASEVITNAMVHGEPPVVVRAWRQQASSVIEVCDAGNQPVDSYADLRPRAGGPHGGFGLWTVGQLAHSVAITHTSAGNSITFALPAT